MLDIYTNPELYDAIHNGINSDNKMITHYAKKCNGPVLELAAGTGRLAKYIIDLELPYTGIDTSKKFINKAKSRFGDHGKFKIDNMQNFVHKNSYNFIFIGFNSFLHNLTDDEANNCLTSINKHLTNDGIFFLSSFIPDPIFLYQGDDLHPATPFFSYKTKRCRIMEKNTYQEESQINHITWTLEVDGILSTEIYSFKQRMIYPHMMDIMLNENEFVIKEKFGDWDHSPLDEFSPLQIYICKKTE